METVTISPKFQVVIPKKIREALHLKSGKRLIMIPYEDRIELVPEMATEELYGILEGMDTTIERDREDRV
ncbi:MAG: AbrB/MazE/SpoVT family DNA-binding domain-containing protein [Candidatus Marinimicrobia bacterium]|nr:AbrB/MazE/SpoVT family DNA-binding domain-containing protein [Candidatus Neomarinimicrobiota bacterium]